MPNPNPYKQKAEKLFSVFERRLEKNPAKEDFFRAKLFRNKHLFAFETAVEGLSAGICAITSHPLHQSTVKSMRRAVFSYAQDTRLDSMRFNERAVYSRSRQLHEQLIGIIASGEKLHGPVAKKSIDLFLTSYGHAVEEMTNQIDKAGITRDAVAAYRDLTSRAVGSAGIMAAYFDIAARYSLWKIKATPALATKLAAHANLHLKKLASLQADSAPTPGKQLEIEKTFSGMYKGMEVLGLSRQKVEEFKTTFSSVLEHLNETSRIAK